MQMITMVTQTLLALSYSMLDVACVMCNRYTGRMVMRLPWLRRPPLMLASLDLRVISFPAQPTWRFVLCCAVLCCAVLCCAVLCCAVLCCAVLCCLVNLMVSN